MFRSLHALMVFGRILGSYAVQWVLFRVTFGLLFARRWDRLHVVNATRLVDGISNLRGVYIKAGQVLSVLGTFLPASYGTALARLQDDVPPMPFARIRVRLDTVFGPALEGFDSIEPEAIAAASLAQVHRARTRRGDDVVVKLLYPGIERTVKADMAVIRIVAPLIGLAFGFRRAHCVVDQLSKMLLHETDYNRERANVERVRAMMADRPEIVVPRVYPELCGSGVLVMSYEPGVKITDIVGMRALGVDPEKVADTLTSCYLSMLLEHRTFHADPHPGNLLVREGDRLVILDYGAVEDIQPHLVGGIKKVMMGGLMRNADLVMHGVEEMGFMAQDGDRELLHRVGREYLAALSELNIGSFAKLDTEAIGKLSGFDVLRGRLRRVAGSLEYPEDYFYVERTIALLFGLVGQLSPTKGLLGVAAPHASRALLRSFKYSNPPPASPD